MLRKLTERARPPPQIAEYMSYYADTLRPDVTACDHTYVQRRSSSTSGWAYFLFPLPQYVSPVAM